MNLTDAKIKKLEPRSKPYREFDRDGLYLRVSAAGGKHWELRYRLAGDPHTASLGAYPYVGLAMAREKAKEAQQLIAQGIHPLRHKKAQEAAKKAAELNSFGAVTRAWIDANAKSWKPYTLAQVKSSMNRYVIENKELGALPIRQVTTKDLRLLLQSIAKRSTLGPGERKATGAVTVARNVRIWCGGVFRFAIERDLADTDPTYPLKNLTELRRPPESIKHNRKLSPAELRQLLSAIDGFTGTRMTGIAIELLMLFFVRTAELRKASWEEFDLDERMWRIPATRMKAKRAHTVPISGQAMALLKDLQGISGTSGRLFPNRRTEGAVMSATTINRALERMGFNGPGTVGLAAHGFRGTASTLLHEKNFDSKVIETQLAHIERDKTKESYNNAKYMPARAEMMQAWADYLDKLRVHGETKATVPQ